MRRKQTCNARTRKGTPCLCKVVEGKHRCRLHGGLSTGPASPQGKRRSAANLRAWRESSTHEERRQIAVRAAQTKRERRAQLSP